MEKYGPEETPRLDILQKTYFKKLKYWFLVENTKNRNPTFTYKTAQLEIEWEVGNGPITRNGDFPVTFFIFEDIA